MQIANLAHEFIHKTMQYDIWLCNISEEDVEKNFQNIDSKFWLDVLKSWACYNYSEDLQTWQPIWYNSLIKIGGNVIFWEDAHAKGLCEISQLLNDSGKLKQFELTTMQANSLISVVNAALKKHRK